MPRLLRATATCGCPGPNAAIIKRFVYVVIVAVAGLLWKLATLAPHMAHGGP